MREKDVDLLGEVWVGEGRRAKGGTSCGAEVGSPVPTNGTRVAHTESSPKRLTENVDPRQSSPRFAPCLSIGAPSLLPSPAGIPPRALPSNTTVALVLVPGPLKS